MSKDSNLVKIWFIYAIPKIEKKLHQIYLNLSSRKTESIVEKINSLERNGQYVVLLYSFNSIQDDTNGNFCFSLISDKNVEYKTRDFVLSKEGNAFLYNVVFERDWYKVYYNNPPDHYELTEHEQYNYFMDYCQKKEDKELKACLVFSTIKLEMIKKPFELDFYLSLFRDCYLKEYVVDLIDKFHPLTHSTKMNIDPSKYRLIIRKMSEPNSIIRKKINLLKDKKAQEIEKKLEYFILYFYVHYSSEDFLPYIETHLSRELLIKIIVDNKKDFKVLNNNQLQKLLSFIKDKQTILSLLDLAKDITALINSVLFSLDQLNRVYLNKSKLEIDKIAKAKETDNLKMLTILYISFEKKSKVYSFLSFSLSFFDSYFKQIERPTKDFLTLKQFFENLETISDDKRKDLINKCNYSIQTNGLQSLKITKMKNIDIINVLTQIEITDSKDALFIGKLFNFDDIDNQFIQLFRDSKFNKDAFRNENCYQAFLNGLLDSVKSCQHLLIFSKLFDELDVTLASKIDIKLIKIISSSEKQIDSEIVKHLLVQITRVYYHKRSEQGINDLIKKIKEKLPQKTYVSIFIDIIIQLNGFYPLPLLFIKEVMPFIISEPPEKIETIISNIDNKDTLKSLFNQLTEQSITEEDFKAKEESQKIMLYRQFYKNRYVHDNEVKGTNYFRITNQNIKIIKEQFTRAEFDLSKSIEMLLIDKEVLRNRLILFFNQEGQDIYDKVYPIFEFAKEYNEIIPVVQQYYLKFYPSQKENINKIAKISEDFRTKKMKELMNDYRSKYSIIINNKDEAFKFTKFLQSNFYRIIYEQSDEPDETKHKEKSEKEFNLLKQMFISSSFFSQQSVLIQKLFKIPMTRKEIENELTFLMNYFKINPANTDSLLQNLLIISSKEEYLKKTFDIIFFISKIGFEQINSEFIKEIEIYQNALKTKSNLNDINKINQTPFIESLQLKCQDKEYQNAYNILRVIHEKETIIEFVSGLELKDAQELYQFIDEADNAFITQDNLNDLIKVIQFYARLKETSKNDSHIFSTLVEICKDPTFEKIAVYFKNVQETLTELKDLYDKVVNKEEFAKEKLKRLSEYSIYMIKLMKREYACNVLYKRDGKNDYTCSIEDVIELRDKSVFIAKKQQAEVNETDGNHDDFYQICNEFSVKLDEITEIMHNAQELTSNGYPEIQIEIEIRNNQLTVYDKSSEKGEKLCTIQNKFKTKLNNLLQNQLKYYQEFHVMSFIFGKKLSEIIDYIRYNRKDNTNNVNHFLKYYTNNQYKQQIKTNYNLFDDEDEMECRVMLENVKDYLTKVLEGNSLSFEKIYSKNIIQEQKYKGLYTLLVSLKEYEENVIKWYIQVTKNYPLAHTVLLCNDSISYEEIAAFLYRALLCPEKVLFFIVKADDLPVTKSLEISRLINALYVERNQEVNSAVVFLYSDQTNQLINYIRNISKSLTDNDIKKVKIPKMKNITVYSSLESGVGKSTFIKKEILNSKKKYVYFPIGGNFVIEHVIERFQKEQFIENQTVVHLDLMETEQMDLMKDFLFSLLITKWYHSNEDIFYLGDKIEIKIEIPSGFTDFKVKFPILSLFDKKEIKIDQLPPMDVFQDPSSNIQVVCNYLKNKNIINTKNLFIPGVSNENIPNKNSITVSPLSVNECEELINKQFMGTENKPTYYQKQAFVNILGTQLKYLSQNINIEVSQLHNNGSAKHQNLLPIRTFILNSFIKNTEHFTKGAYSNLKKSQESSEAKLKLLQAGFDFEKEKQKAIEQLVNKDVISFDKIKPSLVFFNQDIMSFSIISTVEEGSQEYNALMNLWNINTLDNSLKLIDYKQLSSKDFLGEIKKVLDLKNPITEQDKAKLNKSTESLESIVGSYVFTADNYIKMILILQRIRAHIPVIMMGETGCGKTSLIKMISKLLGNEMKILNIHAGISDENIITFMKEKVIPELKTPKIKLPIWVFFDEINTSHSMGLISEIMCKHTMEGEPISNDIIFIGACNPYRTIKDKQEIIGLVKKQEEHVRNLVYNVNPLPYSLLNFVFDFGNLKEEDEKKYIKTMVFNYIDKVFKENKEENPQNCIEKATLAINKSQLYIRNNYDVSSVSLREIRRFGIFYEWFSKILSERSQKNSRQSQMITSFEEKQLNAINLSLYLCYYLRLPKMELRNSYVVEIEKIIEKFLEIANAELDRLIKEIPLQKGIAQNKALKENLFTLFACVNNKIPVFICGKPGCSKTLSVQLLYKAMKGDTSDSNFFKNLPRIQMTSYQGSLTSTSKDIKRLFDKAREIIKDKTKDTIISMIYFDEMGLAEISKNNPLKIIHSELEYDENEKKVAFVGISNWKLDSSKMNRGLFLSIPEPKIKDMQETAITIALSYDQILSNQEDFFNKLAKTYFNFKNNLIKIGSIYEDFHGSRDFYNLIKIAARELINQKNITPHFLYNTAIESLERNFGGRETSIIEIKKELGKEYVDYKIDDEYKVIQCVEQNLKDYECRNLMIISKASISSFLLGDLLNKQQKEFCIYIGSKFKEDTNRDFYSIKILNKIQQCMESGQTIILKDLELIYPSLYEVFNQNFTIVNQKKYARIALGSTNTPMTFVHDNFKCAIIVDQDEVNKQEIPFLNRFEKHIVSFQNLLENKYQKSASNINDMIKTFFISIDETRSLGMKVQSLLINCDLEEIKGIIYTLQEKQIGIQNLNELFLQKVIPTFSQDLIAFTKFSQFRTKHSDLVNTMKKIYSQGSHQNLSKYLEILQNNKSIIYTFSGILEEIKLNKQITMSLLNKEITNDSIIQKSVSVIKSETELDTFINSFIQKYDKDVCIIDFSPSDCIHMIHVKFLIDNILNTSNKSDNKVFIFIVHISREMNKKDNVLKNHLLLSHLSEYNQIFIDKLNGGDILISEIIDNTTTELYHNNSLINIDEVFKDNIYSSLALLNYQCLNGKIEPNDSLIDILSSDEIRNKYISCILRHIEKEGELIGKLFDNKNDNLYDSNNDFIDVLKKYLQLIFIHYQNYIIYKTEQDCLLTKYYLKKLEEKDNNNNQLNELLTLYMDSVDLTELQLSKGLKKNEVKILSGLLIPGSKAAFNQLSTYILKIKHKVNEKEENIRKTFYNDDNEVEKVLEITKEYELNYTQILTNVNYEMKKIWLFEYLEKNQEMIQQQLKKNIISDYYTIYIAAVAKTSSIEFEKVLEILVDKHISQTDSFCTQIAMMMIFLESNVHIISILYDIFENLRVYKPDITSLLKNLIETQKVIYDSSERNPKYKEGVNGSFYIVLEAILTITLQDKKYLEKEDEEMYQYLDVLKNIAQHCSQLEIMLWFTLKELNTLIAFVQVYKIFSLNGIDMKKHLPRYFELIDKEKDYIRDNNVENLKENLEEQFKYFNGILGQYTNFSKMFVAFLYSNYKKIAEDDYRQHIIKRIISNDQFLLESNEFISFIFSSFNIEPIINEDNQEDDEENTEQFLSFTKDMNPIIETFDKSTSIILHEILLYLFERKIFLSLNDLSDNKAKIFGIALKYFKKSLDYLERVYLKHIKDDYSQLAFIYCIAYVKIYLAFFVKLNHSCIQTIGNTSEITKVISGTDKNNFRRMIKIFIFKLFKQYINSFEDFITYDWVMHQISWIQDFSFNDKVQSTLDYLFISVEKQQQYNDCFTCFMKEYQGFKRIEDMILCVNQNGVMIFVDVIINKMISEFKNADFSLNDYSKFSMYATNIFKDPTLMIKYKEMFDFLCLIIDSDKKWLKSIKEESIENFEMFLYCYKLCLLCLNAKGSWYKSLFSKNMIKIIKQSFVPGTEQRGDRLITTVNQLESVFATINNRDEGIYKCSCNYWYQIGPCGMPWGKSTFKCPECSQDISGNDHKIVKRQGHLRIFKNQELRKQVEDYWGPRFGPFDGMLFDELKAEANKLLADEPKGINVISKTMFLDNNKRVRELDMISYRLLSLLVYSLLYFGKEMEYYKPDEIKEFLIKNKTTVDLLKDNWRLLTKSLINQGISSIRIFLNMIFEELEIILSKPQKMNTKEARAEFEKEIVCLAKKAIQNYPNYETKYKEINQKYLERDPTSIKSFVNELELPKSIPEEYPFYQYFMLDSFSLVEDPFTQQLKAMPDNQLKYPIITSCLNYHTNISKLQNVTLMNPFINYMIDKYSFQITRVDAKKKKIEDELKEINDESIKNLCDNFISGYNEVSSTSIKYSCRDDMGVKLISETDPIAYCLLDDGEIGYGMYLAAAYSNFIKWQNDFLNGIINTMCQKKIIPYLKETLEKKIMIQDAKKNDILTITIDNDNSIFSCLEDLFGYFSIRNCFNENGSINYGKYKLVDYQFDLIEEELQKIILPGKKMFNDQIRFVVYGFEGCRNANSSVIQKFIEKYKQMELNDKDKKQLRDYMRPNKEGREQLMFSIQLFILFLCEKSNYPSDKLLNEIILELPKYVKLSLNCKQLFEQNKTLLVNQLLIVFEYIELLCYSSIKENLNLINQPLTEELKSSINEYSKQSSEGRLVNMDNMATAVRRFISRRLCGKRQDQDVNPNFNIFEYLAQPEFWSWEISNDERLGIELDELKKIFEVKSDRAIEFYKIIGKKELETIEENEEEKDKDNEKDEGIKKEKGKMIIEDFKQDDQKQNKPARKKPAIKKN